MKFEKVSKDQYITDSKNDEMYNKDLGVLSFIVDESPEDIYNSIKLPERATKKSAGYDIYAPYTITLNPGDTIKVATGIRVFLEDDKFLMCAPRSGQGFKARLQLDNTVGIIDADYVESKNEGHIMLKLTNDSHNGKSVVIEKGSGMAQAIILPYYTVEDDDATRQRDGGFGSTTKEEKHE